MKLSYQDVSTCTLKMKELKKLKQKSNKIKCNAKTKRVGVVTNRRNVKLNSQNMVNYKDYSQ